MHSYLGFDSRLDLQYSAIQLHRNRLLCRLNAKTFFAFSYPEAAGVKIAPLVCAHGENTDGLFFFHSIVDVFERKSYQRNITPVVS